VSGTVRLTVPAGWTVTPATQPFSLEDTGDETALTFTLRTPATIAPGTFEIAAQAEVGGTVYTQDVQPIAYPHIQTHRLYAKAAATVQAFDVSVADVRVGYVMGSGDQVPDALRRLGVSVDLISDELLATGDLSQFDTIMVGVRASEGREAFVANHGRLLEYVRAGGTLVVQYQQGDYAQRGLPPFPGEIGTRVTDETAAIKVLQPAHLRFTFPNRITDADFNGWIQERHLYAFSKFGPPAQSLLDASDPGEAPNQGGELIAEIGKGRYVYSAYSWFRQLPAGVPGAYRLVANLISLPKAPR
jgi:hypothetical protein